MKAEIIDIEGKKIKEIQLPEIFESKIREDIIKKVYQAYQKNQPYGAYILAGKKFSSSKQSHRRHVYQSLYGRGGSRVPRKLMSRRGNNFHWVGTFIPGTVKGRAAHPPKASRKELKINKKERNTAIESAIAATASKELLEKKYKKISLNAKLPVVIDSSVLNLDAKKVYKFAEKCFGIRTEKKKVRPGKGKNRGRKYKPSRKILLVAAKDENTSKFKNFNFEIAKSKQLNINNLAPGGTPARLTIWTEKAINEFNERKARIKI